MADGISGGIPDNCAVTARYHHVKDMRGGLKMHVLLEYYSFCDGGGIQEDFYEVDSLPVAGKVDF